MLMLSMMRKLKCGEPKSTYITLTEADRQVIYHYEELEDVLVRVNGLLFLDNFVILDMREDS